MSETSTNSAVNSTPRALTVTLAVGFTCALLVSVVSVGLRPLQQANVEAERIAQLQLVVEALADIGGARGISHSLADLEARVVELDSGNYVDGVEVSVAGAERAADSVLLPADADLAGIKRRERYAQIYLVSGSKRQPGLIVLPVRGRGYQSTLYAWLVIDGDTQTIRALKFYRHGETPGVGSRITEPEWEAKWRDLRAFDDQGVLRVGIRGSAGSGIDEYATYKVDAISGATRTTQGVDGMVRFWLGEYGFAPYLKRIERERQ